MVGHGGSSAGSYLAGPTSPIPSHCASIVVTSTVRVKFHKLHRKCWMMSEFQCKQTVMLLDSYPPSCFDCLSQMCLSLSQGQSMEYRRTKLTSVLSSWPWCVTSHDNLKCAHEVKRWLGGKTNILSWVDTEMFSRYLTLRPRDAFRISHSWIQRCI